MAATELRVRSGPGRPPEIDNAGMASIEPQRLRKIPSDWTRPLQMLVGWYLMGLAVLIVVGVAGLVYQLVTFTPRADALFGADANHILGGAFGAIVAAAWFIGHSRP